NDRRRFVRRSIIHHHEFQLRRRQPLLQHAGQRLLDIPLMVVRIYQRCDQRFHQLSPVTVTSSLAKSSPGSDETQRRTSTAALHPISFNRSRFCHARFMASSRSSTVGAFARKPLIPSQISSRFPPTSVAIHARL